jgi:hypothetical protein
MQRFEIWRPIGQNQDFLHGAWVVQPGANSLLVVCDGPFGNGKCLVLAFGPIEEVHIREEFARDWPPALEATRPSGQPFLKVSQSEWAASSNRMARFSDQLTHYCIISGDCCIEILAQADPTTKWAEASAIDTLFEMGLSIGEA